MPDGEESPYKEAKYIDSPILGDHTKIPSDVEREKIKVLVEDCPLGVFQELNKYLNKKGKMLSISVL